MKLVAKGRRTTNVTGLTATTFAGGADILNPALVWTADGSSDYLLVMSAVPFQLAVINVLELVVNLDGAQGVAMFSGAPPGNATTASTGVTQGRIAAPAAGQHSANVRAFVGGSTGSMYVDTFTPTPAEMSVLLYQINIG